MPFSVFYSFSIMFKTHVLQMESINPAYIFSFTSIQKTPIWLRKTSKSVSYLKKHILWFQTLWLLKSLWPLPQNHKSVSFLTYLLSFHSSLSYLQYPGVVHIYFFKFPWLPFYELLLATIKQQVTPIGILTSLHFITLIYCFLLLKGLFLQNREILCSFFS